MSEKSVSELLNILLAKLKCDPQSAQGSLVRQWIDIVGQDLAVHSKVVDLKGPTLYVQADHSTWAQILTLRRGSILQAITKHYPELGLKKIVVITREKPS